MFNYYVVLDDMVDPTSGEVAAVRGDHIRKASDLGKRIAALIQENPDHWGVTQCGGVTNITATTEQLTITDILDGLQESLAYRNKDKDRESVGFWVRWMIRDIMWLWELVVDDD